jgi:hypothetical protein
MTGVNVTCEQLRAVRLLLLSYGECGNVATHGGCCYVTRKGVNISV